MPKVVVSEVASKPVRAVTIELSEREAEIIHVLAGSTSATSVVTALERSRSIYGRKIAPFEQGAVGTLLSAIYVHTSVFRS